MKLEILGLQKRASLLFIYLKSRRAIPKCNISHSTKSLADRPRWVFDMPKSILGSTMRVSYLSKVQYPHRVEKLAWRGFGRRGILETENGALSAPLTSIMAVGERFLYQKMMKPH